MQKSLLFFFIQFFSTIVLAQKDCRQDDYQQQLLTLHPLLHFQYDKIEAFGKKHPFSFITAGSVDTAGISTPFTIPAKIVIPVVVHILWNTSAQNISNAQVLSQIDVLNKDYSGANTDRNKTPAYFAALAADCGITFVLAKMDPQGHATTGIVRKQTSMPVFNFDDKAKSNTANGDDAWNADNYLNIWVCNLVSGISGYASIPGGPKEKDGVVISTQVFGTIHITGAFNKGRTATHEIGHWLNLRHIWGDANCGDDKVEDTPTQQAANRGCVNGQKFTCGSTSHGDMYMNYMDFSDDACMYMFTKGQRERMRVLFDTGGPRNSLLFSNALNGTGLPLQDTLAVNKDAGFDLLLYPNPAVNMITLQLEENCNAIGKKIQVYNHLGQVIMVVNCTSELQQVNISPLHAGLYFIKVDGVRGEVMKKFVKQ
ncbi:MAG: M43 family zinc metalloprotease [Bacteroidota bacterium]